MNRELYHQQHRHHRLIFWVAIYSAIAVVALGSLYYLATRIRTSTLPVGEIQLAVPHSQYVVGESISFTITNHLNAPIYVMNGCPSEPLNVYYKQGNDWVRVHDTASTTDCPKEDRQVAIAANTQMSSNFNAWHNLFAKPGMYRVVAVVEHYNALPYQDFEVIVPPTPAPQPTPAPTPVPYRRATFTPAKTPVPTSIPVRTPTPTSTPTPVHTPTPSPTRTPRRD